MLKNLKREKLRVIHHFFSSVLVWWIKSQLPLFYLHAIDRLIIIIHINNTLTLWLGIPILEECVLVAQNCQRIEIYSRSNAWDLALFTDDDDFRFDSINLDISLTEIYQNVEFE